jgi:hypothetical protein
MLPATCWLQVAASHHPNLKHPFRPHPHPSPPKVGQVAAHTASRVIARHGPQLDPADARKVVVSAARSLCASGLGGAPVVPGPGGVAPAPGGAVVPPPGGAGRSLMMVLEARALLAREEAAAAAAKAGNGDSAAPGA